MCALEFSCSFNLYRIEDEKQKIVENMEEFVWCLPELAMIESSSHPPFIHFLNTAAEEGNNELFGV